ncbi:MAG: hypothetical protein Q9207_006555 [Kuettlingeria erythrocarpa]
MSFQSRTHLVLVSQSAFRIAYTPELEWYYLKSFSAQNSAFSGDSSSAWLLVAYKTFTGGSSAHTVDVATSIWNTSCCGIFAPPGLQLLGGKTGVLIFSNATLPYAVAASPPDGSELPLPTEAKRYGYNVILLHHKSAGVLDIPQSSYVSAVQALLAGGESWNISAPVFASVATFNHSSTRDPDARPSPGDQSLQYIGFAPNPVIEPGSCYDFLPYAKAYDVKRQTRSHGHNSLFLGVSYVSSLVEFLGTFATARNESEWRGPSTATSVAAMDESFEAPKELDRLTAEEAGLVYAVIDTAKYIRPTLRKSGLLYLLLAIQPALVIIILGWMAVLRSTPLDRGFGLVPILSGVDRDSLDSLAGAGLSGELSRSVKLIIRPTYEDAKGMVKYHVAPASPTAAVQNEEIRPKTIYHRTLRPHGTTVYRLPISTEGPR